MTELFFRSGQVAMFEPPDGRSRTVSSRPPKKRRGEADGASFFVQDFLRRAKKSWPGDGAGSPVFHETSTVKNRRTFNLELPVRIA